MEKAYEQHGQAQAEWYKNSPLMPNVKNNLPTDLLTYRPTDEHVSTRQKRKGKTEKKKERNHGMME